MSSMLRTMQKRILKRGGFKRERQRIELDARQRPVVIHLKKGEGDVVNRSGDSFGRRWPFTIPDIGGPGARRAASAAPAPASSLALSALGPSRPLPRRGYCALPCSAQLRKSRFRMLC